MNTNIYRDFQICISVSLRKSHSNDKLLEKRTSYYHMEQKTFIEASYIYNIHTREKIFIAAAAFEGL